VLQRPQPLARLDPELLGEGPASVLVCLQRVRLPVAAIQSEHQLGAQALAVGVFGDQGFELFQHLRVASEPELRLDKPLHGPHSQVIQAGDLGLSERLVGEIREG
jgi:hypothetical protein